MQPADGVPVFRRLSTKRTADVVEYLNPRIAASLLREMHPAVAAQICAAMDLSKVPMILAEMAPDDRVDILNHVPAELREQLIQELGVSKAAEVRRLESYPADSAGGIMTTEAIALPETMTAEQAVAELRHIGKKVEQALLRIRRRCNRIDSPVSYRCETSFSRRQISRFTRSNSMMSSPCRLPWIKKKSHASCSVTAIWRFPS